MSRSRIFILVVSAWLVVAALGVVVAKLMGITVPLTLAAIAILPPVVLLVLFRDAPARSTAGMIYDIEHPTQGGDDATRS